MDKYIVLTASSPESLSFKVNEQLAKGATLVGGVSVYSNTNNVTRELTFAQAMLVQSKDKSVLSEKDVAIVEAFVANHNKHTATVPSVNVLLNKVVEMKLAKKPTEVVDNVKINNTPNLSLEVLSEKL